MEYKSINQLRDEVFENSKSHGFHSLDVKSADSAGVFHAVLAQKLILVHSELSEAVEADHADNFADLCAFDHETGSDCSDARFREGFERYVKNSFEDELADVIIRVLDVCGWLGIDIQRHIELKMRYNRGREFLHGKRY